MLTVQLILMLFCVDIVRDIEKDNEYHSSTKNFMKTDLFLKRRNITFRLIKSTLIRSRKQNVIKK